MKCYFCGSHIYDRYYEDHFGTVSCLKCVENNIVDACDECGRFVRPRRYVISDGRVICDLCRKASMAPDVPQEWFKNQAEAFLNSIGFNLDLSQVRIYNAESEDMNRYMKLPGLDSDLGFHMPFQDDKNDIYIRAYMSKTHYTGVLIHELTHLWQYQNCVYGIPNVFLEGMSQLTSYFFYKAIYEAKKSPVAKRQMDVIISREDEYGVGFREVMQVFKASGWDGVRAEARRLAKNVK